MSGRINWPWVALVTKDGIEYTTREHYDWADHVAEVGCEHAAISVNGSIEKVSCPTCRDAFREKCVIELRSAAASFDASQEAA